ncbi:MAG: HD domain-containing protein, partial [Bacteroidales bacterium]|nr:HD domain-containing protein [Bacteroidales bacterium]
MNSKQKIINDPVFGFINLPTGFLYDLYQHPYLYRLTRIIQLGLSQIVYPGATHCRFQHITGAMFLVTEAIRQLRLKGHEITDAEAEGLTAAVMLHDIGHGPFSHVLEHSLFKGVSHEKISLCLMERLNEEFQGKLDIAIQIFTNQYPKRFLHQLISSQLDVDRLDYLRRDSFFTGVVEGNIGSARIIKMLNVVDDHLVIEAKGIYSIENFLMARRLMYWQVYLHKTSLAAERMLENILQRAKELIAKGINLQASPSLLYFLHQPLQEGEITETALQHFLQLDD